MQAVRKWTSVALALCATSLSAVYAFAQNATVDVTTNESTSAVTTTTWYTNWWVWAAAVAVFLIVVIALTNRGGRSAS